MEGYKAKKSSVLSWDNFEQFLNLGDDHIYLLNKILLIFGIFGAMRTAEMINPKVSEVERYIVLKEDGQEEMRFVIHINDTKTYSSRVLVVGGEHVQYINKYIEMRPDDIATDRFLIRYEKGRCVRQVVGKNDVSKTPKMIAHFLDLEKPETYTGHCYRRSAATLLANTGANLKMLKELEGWKSSAV